MMRQGDVFKSNNYYAGRTGHQFEAALMMRAVGDAGGVKTRRQLPRRVPHEGDVLRVEDALLAQLQVKTSAIVGSANVLVPDDVPANCEDPPERRDDH